MHTFASCLFVVGLTVAAVYDRRDMNECGIERIPLLASPQGGVAERLKRFREASADREAGVVFRENKKENHPVCAEQGSFAASLLTAQPPLLAVMQGGEYARP